MYIICLFAISGIPIHAGRLHEMIKRNAYIPDNIALNSQELHKRDNTHKTPLHLATVYQQHENLQQLVRHGADIDQLNQGCTPLHRAAALGDVPLVRTCVQQGSKVDTQAIISAIKACKKKNEEQYCNVIHELVYYNPAIINGSNTDGIHPLYYGCKRALYHIVATLLEHGACVQESVSVSSIRPTLLNWCDTPLHVALREGSFYRKKDSYHIAQRLIHHGALINSKDEHGNTPLHYGITYEDTVKMLITAGGDVNQKNGAGKTPLHVVSRTELNEKRKANVAQILINNGADIHATSADGMIPLHTAIYDYAHQTAKVLINAGTDITLVDKEGRTALHIAAQVGNTPMLRSLLSQGTLSLHQRDAMGLTPLCKAIYDMETYDTETIDEILDLFMYYGASIPDGRRGGLTPVNAFLRYSNTYGNPHRTNIRAATLQKMIQAGADITRKDDWGMTPLYLAIYHGDVESTRLLLRHGASPDVSTHNMEPVHFHNGLIFIPQTPLSAALELYQWRSIKAQNAIIQALIEHNPDIPRGTQLLTFPLWKALYHQSLYAAQLLIENGAIAPRNIYDHYLTHTSTNQPYHQCLRFDTSLSQSIALLLLEYGIKVDPWNMSSEQTQMTPEMIDFRPQEAARIEHIAHKTWKSDITEAAQDAETDNDHVIVASAALGDGKTGLARTMLNEITQRHDTQTRNNVKAILLLHAERLSALSWMDRQHVDAFIQQHLVSDDVIYGMMRYIAQNIAQETISPHIFKRILERYPNHAHEDILFPYVDHARDTYRYIFAAYYAGGESYMQLVRTIAQRVRSQLASQAEVQTILDRDNGHIACYRDNATGNTFLHEIAYHPGLIRLAQDITEKVTAHHDHPRNNETNPYGDTPGKTPVMIAKEQHNTGFVDMCRGYRFLNRCSQTAYEDKLQRARIWRQHPREPHTWTTSFLQDMNNPTLSPVPVNSLLVTDDRHQHNQRPYKRKRQTPHEGDREDTSVQQRTLMPIQADIAAEKQRLPRDITSYIISFCLNQYPGN